MHYLIIGAGPAGVNAAEHLRKLDPAGRITLLAAENVPPYSRMALPYYLVGNIDATGTYLRKAADHFERLRIELKHGRASFVDTESRHVTLLGGETIDYDKLLVATGATATRPPIPGVDRDGVHNCWSLADAHRIIEDTEPGSKVILMGAGFIGCIILEALAARKVDLTVIEMEERMVSRMTNEAMGSMIKRWCEKEGIQVMTSTTVEAIDREGRTGTALGRPTDGGETLRRTRHLRHRRALEHRLLDGTAASTSTSASSSTTAWPPARAASYAAGDVAQGKRPVDRRVLRAGHPADRRRARQARREEHGQRHRTPHAGTVNMNVLDTVGLISTSFGLWMGVEGGDSATMSNPERFEYLNLQFQDDVLVGASTLGMTDHVGVMRGLIQTGSHLGDWKAVLMAEPNRLPEAYLASAQSLHDSLAAA